MTQSEFIAAHYRERDRRSAGFLYLAFDASGEAKVGYTGDVAKRIDALARVRGCSVRLASCVASLHAYAAEQRVHRLLDPYRISEHPKGEWYRLPDGVASRVPAMLAEEAEDTAEAARLLATPLPSWVKARDLARWLGLAYEDVLAKCRSGEVASIRTHGRQYRIPLREAHRHLSALSPQPHARKTAA